jgi:S1-C subfamily serine protease
VAPFELAAGWRERADAIAADLPWNFTSTHDITGGNSGSPMVNRKGELVGLVFDGNAAGLASDFAYRGERGRAVSVHPAAMVEALQTIYQAERIVAELGL